MGFSGKSWWTTSGVHVEPCSLWLQVPSAVNADRAECRDGQMNKKVTILFKEDPLNCILSV